MVDESPHAAPDNAWMREALRLASEAGARGEVPVGAVVVLDGVVVGRGANRPIGAREPRAGAVVSTARILELPGLNHRVECVEGLLGEEAQRLMQEFFRSRRST